VFNLIYNFRIDFGQSFTIPFTNFKITTQNIIDLIPLIIFLSVKFGFYAIAFLSEQDGIKTDFVFYVNEFFSNTFNIIGAFVRFFFLFGFLMITVVGGIYYLNTRGYFGIFVTRLDGDGNLNTSIKMHENSSELASKHAFKLIFFNSIILIIFAFLYYFMPILPEIREISITNYLKQVILDNVFVYSLYIGTGLQSIKNKEKQKEEMTLQSKKHERRMSGMAYK
jgi:hypothetical protein